MHEVERRYINRQLERKIDPKYRANPFYKSGIKAGLAIINGTFASNSLDKMKRQDYIDIMDALTGESYNFNSDTKNARSSYTRGLTTVKEVVTYAYSNPLEILRTTY